MDFDPAAGPRAELGEALRRRTLPVYGLDAQRPCRIGDWDTAGDVLTRLQVDYGDDDSWVSVHTGTTVPATPLAELVKTHLRMQGRRFADQEWSEGETRVVVDGAPVPGREVRAGDDWRAARVTLGDVEISLIAYRWTGGTEVRARTPAELDELVAQPRVRRRRRASAGPRSSDAEPAGEPHRLLVDTVLASSRDHQAWLEDGGPVPELPAAWRSLWERTVRRQAELADQSEDVARGAVESLTGQLSRLQGEATWFRDDGRLREGAIAETLLWTTGLSLGVPSRAAQEAWRDRERVSLPGEPSVFESVAAADSRWIEAWHAWARR